MKIAKLGSPVLSKVCERVEIFDEKLKTLVSDMFETLEANPGIGLAGPQVEVPLRLFVVKLDDYRQEFINPEITYTSASEISVEEGCLSIPGVWHDVMRPEKITIYAQDENGKSFHLDAEGLLARVIQHENDHLNGKLFIDKLPEVEHERLVHKYEKMQLRSKRKRK